MSDQLFEHAVREWLDDGSDRTPPASVEAVLLAVKTTPQERALRIPRRFFPMPTSLRLAVVIAIIAIAGVGAAIFMTGRSDPLPIESPAVSTAPSPTGGRTADWIAYTSERYGFDIKRPPDFVETPATTYWEFSFASDFPAAGTEDFYVERVPGQGVRVSAWSFGVEPGTTLETFVQDYCVESGGSACPSIMDSSSPATTQDGHEGVSIAGPTLDSQVFVLVNDRVYIVSAWRADNDPSVLAFGGGRLLVEDFASTLALRPEGPAPEAAAPALTESFASGRYGYSIDFPGDVWMAVPAGYLLEPGVDGPDDWSDRFMPPTTPDPANTAGPFRAASVAIPEGVTDVDTWIGENLTEIEGSCAPSRSTLGDIVIDGQTGKVRSSCEEVEATVVVGDRVYLFTLFLNGDEPTSTAGGRALFEAMAATVQLTPETAEVAPSPAAS